MGYRLPFEPQPRLPHFDQISGGPGGRRFCLQGAQIEKSPSNIAL